MPPNGGGRSKILILNFTSVFSVCGSVHSCVPFPTPLSLLRPRVTVITKEPKERSRSNTVKRRIEDTLDGFHVAPRVRRKENAQGQNNFPLIVPFVQHWRSKCNSLLGQLFYHVETPSFYQQYDTRYRGLEKAYKSSFLRCLPFFTASFRAPFRKLRRKEAGRG